MKALKWIVLAFGLLVCGYAGFMFVGGNSPIAWSRLSYTDAVAEAANAGKPLLIDFYNPL